MPWYQRPGVMHLSFFMLLYAGAFLFETSTVNNGFYAAFRRYASSDEWGAYFLATGTLGLMSVFYRGWSATKVRVAAKFFLACGHTIVAICFWLNAIPNVQWCAYGLNALLALYFTADESWNK